jgi:predicted SAM-dependent methyltransferase
MTHINIGCGSAKIKDAINIDACAIVQPDLVLDITHNRLPYEDDSVDYVTMFHTIEHIEREKHPMVIGEINRVLKPSGRFDLAYPDAEKCIKNYLNNKWGMRTYWEKTILGRGLTTWDCHRALIYTDEFIPFLREFGFGEIKVTEEVGQGHNTIIRGTKQFKVTERTDLLRKEVIG